MAQIADNLTRQMPYTYCVEGLLKEAELSRAFLISVSESVIL